MKAISTILPYYVYKNLAESKQGFPGDQDFINLLIPALKGLEDHDIIIFIGRIQESQISRCGGLPNGYIYTAIEISIIREYVYRVELERQSNWEMQKKMQEIEEAVNKKEDENKKKDIYNPNIYKDQYLQSWATNTTNHTDPNDLTIEKLSKMFEHFSWKNKKGKS